MVVRSRLLFAMGALVSVAAIMAACGSTGGTGGTCVPGATQTCACVGGMMGAQACSSDGKSFGMCQCGSATTSTGAGGSTGSTGTLTGAGGGSGCQCTNPSSELYCGVAICDADGGATTGTGGSTSDAGSCANHVTFAGAATMQLMSNWSYGGKTGTAAGDALCQAQAADHVCDYDDLVDAAAAGELSAGGVMATDHAWLLRYHSVTTTATSNIETLGKTPATGTTLKVGSASRCADWTYSTDHLNDGEFVSFEKGADTPTFHLDDNPCLIQTAAADPQATGLTAKDIPCGHDTIPRTILCCYPKCKTVAPDTCTCDPTTNMCM